MAWAELAEPNLQDPLVWKTDAGVGAGTDLLVASDTLFAAAGEKWFWTRPRSSAIVCGDDDIENEETGTNRIGRVD